MNAFLSFAAFVTALAVVGAVIALIFFVVADNDVQRRRPALIFWAMLFWPISLVWVVGGGLARLLSSPVVSALPEPRRGGTRVPARTSAAEACLCTGMAVAR